jgi:hypothetical protein
MSNDTPRGGHAMTDPPNPTPAQDGPLKRRPGSGRTVRNLTRVAWVVIGGGAALVLIPVLSILLLV